MQPDGLEHEHEGSLCDLCSGQKPAVLPQHGHSRRLENASPALKHLHPLAQSGFGVARHLLHILTHHLRTGQGLLTHSFGSTSMAWHQLLIPPLPLSTFRPWQRPILDRQAPPTEQIIGLKSWSRIGCSFHPEAVTCKGRHVKSLACWDVRNVSSPLSDCPKLSGISEWRQLKEELFLCCLPIAALTMHCWIARGHCV